MPFAVIKIANIDKREAGYIHFKCSAQKNWNCNKQELIADLAAGERYKIDYAETAPTGDHKYGSKYVNRARPWQPEDGDNTWPDKAAYQGGGNQASGGNVSKDFDTETSKRQTAANCAGTIYANCMQGGGAINLDEFAVTFPVLAEVVLKFVDSKGNVSDVAGAGSAPVDEFDNSF